MSSHSSRLIRSRAGFVALGDDCTVRRRVMLAIEPLAPSQQERRLFCFSAARRCFAAGFLAKELIEI
jgi:hypothetical protein